MNKRDAERAGREQGEAAANGVFDGNTTPETFIRTQKYHEEGSPRLDEIVIEPTWLSGEMAGESINELLPDLPEDMDRAAEYVTVYEEAASRKFWQIIERDIRRGVKNIGQRCDYCTRNYIARCRHIGM